MYNAMRYMYNAITNINVDVLAKVYVVHLKVEHCQTLRVVSTFTGQNEPTVFDW